MVGCSVVPTVQLVFPEVGYMVHYLGQLTQEGKQNPLLTSLILAAVVLVLIGLVQRLKTWRSPLAVVVVLVESAGCWLDFAASD